LERLGFEVYYLEDTGLETYDPTTGEYSESCTYGVGFLDRALSWLSPTLNGRWHFRASNGRCFGMTSEDIAAVVADADLLLNVSGASQLREPYLRCRRKVLVDTDPGRNHFVNYPATDAIVERHGDVGYRAHDWLFTYAEQIGQPHCRLPTLGIDWQPTRPVVIGDRWQAQPPGSTWTTVMTWNNFQRPIVHEGTCYGAKEMEFGRIETLPMRVPAAFEVAVGGKGAPVERWRSLGWDVVDSHAVSPTADAYRAYIEGSRGEFSVAKNIYVATQSGWFSCRSVCYLAAGRPVVVQDTGFSSVIPTGSGLVAFTDLIDAVRGIEVIERDYGEHQAAARDLAQTYFSAEVVLGDLLARIGLG
jgi:hypothetical protein